MVTIRYNLVDCTICHDIETCVRTMDETKLESHHFKCFEDIPKSKIFTARNNATRVRPVAYGKTRSYEVVC